MELVRNTAFGYEIDHLRHLVAASGHHESYAVGLAQYSCCGLYEILGTLLHSDSTQERDKLVFALRLRELLGMRQRLYGIMYRTYLARIDTIFLYNRPSCQVTYANDMICCVHTAFLYRINRRVDVAAATVEIGRVNVDYQRFAADLLGKYTRRISQPVVAVDNIKFQTVS